MSDRVTGQERTTKSLGLRERKKLATRVTLRRVAYELFREQGYDETTVAQIAAAAEVSPATFFRYFATKEALILEDDYDAVFLADVPPIDPAENIAAQILRGGADMFESLDDAERETETERGRLLYSSPSLRAAQAQQMEDTAEALEQAVIENVTAPVDRMAVRAAVGAVIGAINALGRDDPAQLLPERMRALGDLFEAGLPVTPATLPESWERLLHARAGRPDDASSPRAVRASAPRRGPR